MSSGHFDCEKVDNSSRDEKIDEQLHEKECLGNHSDPSSQLVSSSPQKET